MYAQIFDRTYKEKIWKLEQKIFSKDLRNQWKILGSVHGPGSTDEFTQTKS